VEAVEAVEGVISMSFNKLPFWGVVPRHLIDEINALIM